MDRLLEHTSRDDDEEEDRRYFQHRSEPGTESGTVVSDPERSPTKVTCYVYAGTEFREITTPNLSEVSAWLQSEQIIWLDVDGVGDAAVIHHVGEIFGLHPLALEDVAHVHQRAKVEEYGDYLYIVSRMHAPGDDLTTEQVSLFLGKNWVITFQDDPDNGDCFQAVRTRLRENRGRIRTLGADYLAYSLVDAIIDAYFPVVEEFGNILDELEDKLLENPKQSPIHRIHEIRRNLRELRRILWPHREAINALLRDRCHLIRPETQLFLRDCYDHTVQLIDVTESLRESCTDLRELHLAELSQRSNDVMQVLTVIAIMFMPMTFLAGLYGMNFDPEISPFNMPELRWYFGYPFALAVMALMELTLLGVLWYRGWLSGRWIS